jgi:hypothetical protein
LLTCPDGLHTLEARPECVVAGAFCVSCCDCTHLLAFARRLTHTKHAYALLAFEHGQCIVNHGADVVASLVFFFFFLTLGGARSLTGGGARIGGCMVVVGVLHVDSVMVT